MLGPFWRLPTPFELGRSEHDDNSLPDRHIGNPHKSYSWQDYDEECRLRFPYRYWWDKRALRFLQIAWMRFRESFVFECWRKIRSRYIDKDHLLDLRQEYGPNSSYHSGPLHDHDKLLYAAFGILVHYCRNYGNVLLEQHSRAKETIKELKDKERDYMEERRYQYALHIRRVVPAILDLYVWWTVTRVALLESIQSEDANSNFYYLVWHEYQELCYAKLQELADVYGSYVFRS